MLSPEALRAALGRFSYKPGWSFRLTTDPFEGLVVWAITDVENSYRPGEPVRLEIETFVPPMADETAFFAWLLWRLARIEVHECREWAKVDGVPISDPHVERAPPEECREPVP